MQWIKAVVLNSFDTMHTVKCFVLHYPYNNWSTLTGNWQTSPCFDFADAKPHEGDVAGGI
eukprot:4895588-Ditylum_brightwellii.AAC.1